MAVDAVVPVHNAPALARRCIESVLAHIGAGLGELVVVDDASDAETQQLLVSLAHPRLRVVRSERNLGYGGAVNLGLAQCRAPLVLQLNSDVETRDDFLAPLGAAIPTNHLSGYAFLIRRSVFDAVGGFDPAYGRGYFEDTDLSRRILRTGAWLGVHPDTDLHRT